VVVVRKNADLKNTIVVWVGVNGHVIKIIFVVSASGAASRKRMYLVETVLVFRSKHPKVELNGRTNSLVSRPAHSQSFLLHAAVHSVVQEHLTLSSFLGGILWPRPRLSSRLSGYTAVYLL
jgi:hypothetical protein